MVPLLLQWADSAYPTGGFAYSSGLEAMARLPAFADLEDLQAYFRLVLRQALSADMPYLLGMHGAVLSGDIPRFRRLAWEWDAFLHQPGIRRASLAQGEAWLRLAWDGPLAKRLPEYPGSEMDGYGDEVLPSHWIPVMAWLSGHLALAENDMRSLYLHLILRDQISASVRLGLVGANQAQKLQAELGPIGDYSWMTSPVPDPEDAARGAPVLEIAQVLHAGMYVRLFQN